MGLSDPVEIMSMQIIDWHFYMAWTSAGDSGVCRWGCFKKSGFGSGGVRLFGRTIRKRNAYTGMVWLHALLHDTGSIPIRCQWGVGLEGLGLRAVVAISPIRRSAARRGR